MTTWLFDQTSDDASASDVLDITLRFDGEVTVCILHGPVGAYTAPTLHDRLTQLHDTGRHRVVIDASHVALLSGDGVDVLVDHAARCRAAGGALLVRDPSAGASHVLALCDAAHLVEQDHGSS